MSVKLRLARRGTRKRPFYWLVAADGRMPRDGRFIEKLGTYDPRPKPSLVDLKTERVNHWLDNGAEVSDAVREILRDQGVLKTRAGVTPERAEAAEPAAE